MGFCLGRMGMVLVTALLLSAPPAAAKSAEPHDDSFSSQFESLGARVKADSERALAAAAEAAALAIEASKGAIAEAEKNLAPRLQTFRQMLNEQKARFATLGEDATAQFDEWKQAFTESWAAAWPDIRRSAAEALDRFRDWIEKQSASDEQPEIRV